MFPGVLIAACLMAVCVIVHGVGLTAAIRWAKQHRAADGGSFWRSVLFLIVFACWVIFLHLVEISSWAFVYAWGHALPDLPSALYFSVVTYTTTGYGDLVLPEGWRLVGGVEALTGILMCGWSTGIFFAVVSRMHSGPGRPNRSDPSNTSTNQAGRPK